MQVNADGSKNISSVISGDCSTPNNNSFLVYPNPSKEIINIKLSLKTEQNIFLGLYDNKGSLVRSVFSNMSKGDNFIQLDISELPKGVYLLSGNWENTTKTIYFIKN